MFLFFLCAFLQIIFFPAVFVSASSCPAFPAGFYAPDGDYIRGAPETNDKFKFTLNPGYLSCDDVKRLNTYCIARINKYRSGEIKFSNDKADPDLGTLKPYVQAMDAAKCQAEISLGDFSLIEQSCGQGAHKNAFHCPKMQGNQAQNLCCPMRIDKSYKSVTEALDICLQVMWDEGMGVAAEQGHWRVMKSPMYTYGVCAFSFATNVFDNTNYVLMNQNFASFYEGEVGTLAPTKRPTTLAPTKAPTRKPTPTAVCGNGIVEQGEECDCGSRCEQDSCCNGATCQFVAGAQCSALDACCNKATCRPLAKDTVCAAADNGCEVEQKCDGRTGTCPAKVVLKTGQECTRNGSPGFCTPCKTCVPNFTQQCRNFRPDWTRVCSWYPAENMCQDVWCEHSGDSTGGCVGTATAAFASKCGEGMSCSGAGKCVKNSDLVCPPTAQRPPTTRPTTSGSVAPPPTTKQPTSKSPTTKQPTSKSPTRPPTAAVVVTPAPNRPPTWPQLLTPRPVGRPSRKPVAVTRFPTKKVTAAKTKFPTKKRRTG